ncbi:MAG: sulfotransferase [Alphaproteobacteria bacterium]|nr:sulfotransferase [Alphaproteobacteria bacterium]
MQPKLHFIAGLPRSGSTLLAALLRQNPRFHARISSPVCPLFGQLVAGMAGEAAALVTDAQRERILRGLFDSYYADQDDKTVVFDTNRGWCGRLSALNRVVPEARIICMVRNVAWVMDSIERLIRKNPLLPSRLFADDAERATVYSRCDAIGHRNRLVGGAWSALKEAFYGEDADRLLVVEYEYLTRAPQRTMALIYEFLGEEPFAHQFDNLDYDEPEFDEILMTPGLHKVRRKVEFVPRRTILPPDLFERFNALSFWTDPAPSLANIVAPKRSLAPAEQNPAPPAEAQTC